MQRVGAAIGEGARTIYSSSMSMSPRIAFSTTPPSSSPSFSTSSSSLSSPFLTADLTSQESRARCLAKIAKMKPLRPADGPVVDHELI